MANLIGTYTLSSEVDCLLPGTYTVQVSGTDTTLPATSFPMLRPHTAANNAYHLISEQKFN